MAFTPARLSLLCLGTGRGSTAVYHGEASSSFVLLADARPLLLVDLGVGVTRACRNALGDIPDTVLVTHNHSDHAAELPVVLAVEAQRGRRLRLIAGPAVMPLLEQHRLAELASTGQPLAHFAEFVSAQDLVAVDDRFAIELLRARHTEPCYGFILHDATGPLFGYGGDSGYDAALYERLFAAPKVLIDARAEGSAEHAGFDEVAAFADTFPDHDLWVTGYGSAGDAPTALTPLRPGDRIRLDRGTSC